MNFRVTRAPRTRAGGSGEEKPRSIESNEEGFDVKVRECSAGEEPQVIELLGMAFDAWPGDLEGVQPSEFFRWKYRECPFGDALLYVAELDGAIVGFQARLRWRLRCGPQIMNSTRATDLAVHPDHQRHGVSLTLRRRAEFPPDIHFSWGNPNLKSRPGSFRLGHTYIGAVTNYLRPHASAAGATRMGRVLGIGEVLSPTVDAPAAAEVLADSDRVQRLLARVPQPAERLVTDRDLEYLRWRYGRFAQYRAVSCDSGAAGMAIFRLRRRSRFWLADVCELLVEDNNRRTTRKLLGQVARASGADVLCCCFDSHAAAVLHRFAPALASTVLLGVALASDLRPDPTAISSWALSRGDLDELI